MTGVCELNIRIDAIDLPDSKAAVGRREADVIAEMQRLGAVAHRRVIAGRTHKLVAQVRADDVPAEVLHRLAKDLHQDCVAIYYPATGEGRLVGPRADLWARFSVADFERYAPSDSTEFVATLPQGVKPKQVGAAMRKITGRTQMAMTFRQQLEAAGFKTAPSNHWIYSEGASSHFFPAIRVASGQDESNAEPVAPPKANAVAVRLLAALKESWGQDEPISAEDVDQLIVLEDGEQVAWVSSTWIEPELVNLFTCSAGAESITVVATRHGDRGVLVGFEGRWHSVGNAKEALGDAPEGWSDV